MKKKIIAFLLAFVLILSVIPFPAMAATLGQGNCGDNLTWKLSDTGTLTISGTGAMYDYNSSDAPWKIKTAGKIKKVVVKDGVTSIGDNAFWACSNLKSVTLPDSVTSIGWSAFSNCPIPEITLPANLKTIEARAFETTNLSSIKIPSKVKTIGMMAFSGTKLETVAVPASVTVLAGVDYTAFYHIETLKEIKVSSSNKNYSAVDGVLFNKDKTQLMQYPQAKSGSSYTIPSSVKIIGPGAFYGVKLTEITIPKGVQEISYESFYYAYKLKSITIPSTVKRIHPTAFGVCYALKEFDVSSSNQYFSDKDGVLFNKDQTELIRYPVCKTTREYTVPSTVSYIHSNAFDYNGNLQVLTIPNSVQQIENYLTEGCDNLQRIVFQGNVPSCSYPNYAFSWDGNLIYYPSNNKTWTKAVIDEFENDGDGNTMVPYDPNLPSPTITAGNNYTTGKIKLSWKAVKDAKTYYIYRSDSKYGEYTLIASTGSTTYTDTSNNLSAGGKTTAGKRYYYRVDSIAEGGIHSLPGDPVARTCNLPRVEITAKNTASSGKIRLSWDKVSGAEKYTVYRATSKDGDYSKLGSTSNTYFTDSTAKVGKRYYYKVVAVHKNTDGNSAKSLPVARTRDLPQPDISVKLNSSKQPKISWAEIENAEKYYVYRKAKGDEDYTRIKSTSSTSFTDKEAKKGTTYYYKVKAIHKNTGANSALSDYAKIKKP